MRVELNQRTVDLVTSISEVIEGMGLLVLAATAIALAGSILGLTVMTAVVFSAVLIHSALRHI